MAAMCMVPRVTPAETGMWYWDEFCADRTYILIALIAATLRRASGMSAATIHKAATFFARTSHADSHFAVTDVETVEHTDRFLGLRLVAHFHKRETLGLTAITILNQRDRGNSTCLKEQGA